MDEVTWLIDKLTVPLVLHDQSDILHANAAFTMLLSNGKSINDLNFIQWLTHVIVNKKDASLLAESIKHQEEITLITDGQVNGTLFHWTICSFMMPPNQQSPQCRATYLEGSSSTEMQKIYPDLHVCGNGTVTSLTQGGADRTAAESKATQLDMKITQLQQEMMHMSHQAAMAEVVVSVLHNIGNVLNSVGVSVSVMKNNLNDLMYQKVGLVKGMLQEHEEHITEYFQNDDKGKLLPKYFAVLFEEIQQHKSIFEHEVDHLQQQYLLMKDILSVQNELASSRSVHGMVCLPEVVDHAIRTVMSEDSMLSKHISLTKDCQYAEPILTNKNHLIQLIINLLTNAKESLMALPEGNERKITVSILKKEDPSRVELVILDSGIGISPENLSKLFTFGFTTKPKGHGFGLHNSTLIAKQLGGTLRAESMGINKGAAFILTLPLAQTALRTHDEQS